MVLLIPEKIDSLINDFQECRIKSINIKQKDNLRSGICTYEMFEDSDVQMRKVLISEKSEQDFEKALVVLKQIKEQYEDGNKFIVLNVNIEITNDFNVIVQYTMSSQPVNKESINPLDCLNILRRTFEEDKSTNMSNMFIKIGIGKGRKQHRLSMPEVFDEIEKSLKILLS